MEQILMDPRTADFFTEQIQWNNSFIYKRNIYKDCIIQTVSDGEDLKWTHYFSFSEVLLGKKITAGLSCSYAATPSNHCVVCGVGRPMTVRKDYKMHQNLTKQHLPPSAPNLRNIIFQRTKNNLQDQSKTLERNIFSVA